MDRQTAARVLGVPVDASPARVNRAYRARARLTHPDRFPPGSEAWEDAGHAMQSLNEARHALGVPAPPPPTRAAAGGTAADGSTYAGAPSWERSSEGFRSPSDADRLARAWGYGWGAFLVVSAVVSWFVGYSAPVNDALPLWSPALAAIGLVSLGMGLRADRRIRARRSEGRRQE
ncbi:MAG TPA: J domain-containing protein [Candidatus Angelobacter sp.]|nr:J domain-containing protein [Candidatus Angelobacter sp.]